MYLRRGLGGVVQDVAAAIARQENVNPAYNNPGGLIAAPGCTSRPGQIAICPDAATGQADLERQVQLYVDRGATLASMLNAWAPASCAGSLCAGNNPSIYTQNVSAWTGLPADIPLSTLVASGGTSIAAGSGSDSSVSALDLSSLPSFDISSIDPSLLMVGAGIGILALFLAFRS
jgi:hypothetical protein